MQEVQLLLLVVQVNLLEVLRGAIEGQTMVLFQET
jgi:hypothetical protein